MGKATDRSIRNARQILSDAPGSDGTPPGWWEDLDVRDFTHATLPREFSSGAPCYVDFCQFTFVTKGQIGISINTAEQTLGTGDIAFFSVGNIVQVHGFSGDYESTNVMLSGERLLESIGDAAGMQGDFTHMMAATTKEQASVISDVFSAIAKTVRQEECPNMTAKGLIDFLYHYFMHIAMKSRGASMPLHERQAMDGFTTLVYRNCVRERSLEFYAGKLGTSTRHLGTLVKRTSGISAKRWIDNAVTARAKAMLRHGNMPVVAISSRLGFPNPSFFSKFFRRMTGMTPLQYRNGVDRAVPGSEHLASPPDFPLRRHQDQ